MPGHLPRTWEFFNPLEDAEVSPFLLNTENKEGDAVIQVNHDVIMELFRLF